MKNTNIITNLSASPEKKNETIALIEECFNYPTQYSFETDFYPLVNSKNAINNHILIDQHTNEVIAHVGVKKRLLNVGDETFSCVFTRRNWYKKIT